MKNFCFASLMLSIGFALMAQTNSTSPAPEALPSLSAGQTNAPTEVQATQIQSESGQFYMKFNVFVYRGNVRIDNPQMKLRCELLTVEAPRTEPGEKFNRVTAETNVVIDWADDKGQPNHATADKAVYTYSITNLMTNAAVVLTGNPVVTNAQGAFQGDPIIWDRIHDTISSPHLLKMTIKPGETNTPGLFDTTRPPKADSQKPTTDETPK